MDLEEFVYEEVNEIIFNEEVTDKDIEDERNNLEWTPNYVEFETDSVQCGVVMVARGGGLTLVCSLCMQPFSDLETFGSHLQDLHIKSHFEGEVDNALMGNLYRAQMKLGKLELRDEREVPPNDFAASLESYNPNSHMKTRAGDNLLAIDNLYRAHVKLKKLKFLEGKVLLVGSTDNCCAPNKSHQQHSSSISLVDASDESSQGCEQAQPPNTMTNNQLIEMQVDNQKLVTDAPVTTLLKTCRYCDQQFTNIWSFKAHLLNHKGPKRFECSYCPKKFKTSAVRNAHVNIHTGDRPHKCPHCPKGFAHGANLAVHIRAHLQIFKFSCSYCGKRFVQSGSHKIHERMHTGEKPYQCEECGKRFICQMRLTIHSRTHAKVKNHKCEICSKAFHSVARLREHMRTHSDERPFHCNICDKRFPRRSALRAHKQLHSDVKKYVCAICGKAFAQHAGLYSHKKSHIETPVSI